MQELRFFVLDTGRVICGKVLSETDKHYHIEGFYLVFTKLESNIDVPKQKVEYEPFSPVGGLIQKLYIKKDKVIGEQDFPEVFKEHLQMMFQAELYNLKRKKALLSMQVNPTRVHLEPEQVLARMCQFVEEKGKLPSVFIENSYSQFDGKAYIGKFKEVKISPLRKVKNV